MRLFLFLVSSIFILHISSTQANVLSAENLYRDYQQRIFQIQVIDLASNKKSSIGSGFLVADSGLIATNYHVIAETIHAPGKFRIEYLDSDGNTGKLVIRGIDVIHDLAIVSSDITSNDHIHFSQQALSKGAHIYAIGNPHDLGMSIIEGTFNGLLEKSQYQKILFSGSLNPGMSGGPALDQTGKLIGINVSTAGNDLSFLVPAIYLQQLLNEVKNQHGDFDALAAIEKQLFDNQQNYMQQILQAEWQSSNLGAFSVPAELMGYFKCWGKTSTEEDRQYEHTYSACASPDAIYISPQFDTGNIDFRYDWYEAGELNSFQFYSMYENKFAASYSTNRASKEDVSNYRCNTDFVEINDQPWKVALCLRNYKQFPLLYDLSLTMAQIENNDRGLVVNMNATGVSRDNAVNFARKYMESIQ